MIDIHNHILSYLDDEAATIQESVETAKAVVKNGIDKIIAAPKHLDKGLSNPADRTKAGTSPQPKTSERKSATYCTAEPGSKASCRHHKCSILERYHVCD